MTRFDVGIVGLGAMGSMAARELAARGKRVIGFDRFHPPHPFGSSHGKSRIIREAYFEHPQYVPLVQRAYEWWALLERQSGRSLLVPTGGLMIGMPDGALIGGARRSALEHRLPYEEFSAAQARERFPLFRLGEGEVGLFEPRAGVLFPEAALEAALQLAEAAGAELHFDEPVTAWSAGEGITLRTAARHWGVDRLILSAGAWLANGIARAPLPLRVARQTLFWFTPASDARGIPVFIWEWAPNQLFYGFPDLGDGVKVAIHHQGEETTPEQVRRTVYPDEATRLREVMATRTPQLLGPLRDSAVCLYTNTPDGDFLLDRHPEDGRVLVCSPCSGHGFKFAPTIGEVLADLVEDKPPRFDLSPFRLSRF
ncbi:MAG TPA: N-methyl-L-tryptophan oxidase [Gemmatimonadales bacterium]|nr:N-methyl-L-tryptophan oxidase [Gemmatimonadales bacterium]